MKRCPKCGREYDNSMMFCLDDGAELLYGPGMTDGPATAILSEKPVAADELTPPRDVSEFRTPILRPSAAGTAHSRGRTKRLLFGLGLAAIFLGGFLAYKYLAPANSKQIGSIAVMPFVNDSGNAEAEYLSDGMTETLIRTLSQLPNLNVKSRSSVFRYKGKETDAKTISSELGVQAILNGHVIQRGEQLSLSLELIDPLTENVIWTDRYDRTSSDLVSLQNEIARDVSSKLKLKLSGEDEQKLAKADTKNSEAYKLYLQGRFYWNKRDAGGFKKAVDYFTQAVASDPNYALAYAGLADTYALLSSYGFVLPSEGMPKAEEFARKAIGLDETIAEPHATLGMTQQAYSFNFEESEREFKKAIELNPNYMTAHQWYGEMLTVVGRFDEAAAEYRRALEIEPLSLPANWEYARYLYHARKYDEAIAQYTKVLEMSPSFQTAHRGLGEVYRLRGDYAKAVDGHARAFDLTDEHDKAEAIRTAFAKDGWNGYLRLAAAENSPLKYRHSIVARSWLQLGDKDKAFEELNKGYELREAPMQWLKVEPQFDELRDDPRFKELLRRMNFPE